MKYNNKKYLRKWPYPYVAALSISNDFDFSNFDFFQEFIRFLRTSDKTELGVGLSLDITSSMFFYGNPLFTASYFSGTKIDAPRSKYADVFDDFLKEGVFDANHSFGDFNSVGGASRQHAEKVYETLDKLGVQLKIFINHGDAYNSQNLGLGYSHHKGCDPLSPYYHADLLKKNGVQYIWSQNLCHETLKDYNFKKQQLVQFSLQDKQPFLGFYRFRGTGQCAPNLSSLAYQVNSIDFDDLYKKASFLILYQHLGVLYRMANHCAPATIQSIKKRPEILYPLYKIKSEKEKGKLLVWGLEKLLKYINTYNNVEIKKDHYVMNTFFINGEFTDTHSFSGLTLYIDPTSPAHIFYKNKKLEYIMNGPDETSIYSVTVL